MLDHGGSAAPLPGGDGEAGDHEVRQAEAGAAHEVHVEGEVYVDGYRSPLFYVWRRELIGERARAMKIR